MADQGAIIEYVDGVISSANDKGLKLNGEESWRNLSKFQSPATLIPVKGTSVHIGLDKGGFIRTIERASGEQIQQQAPQQNMQSSESRQAYSEALEAKDQRITRLACMNTSVAMLAQTEMLRHESLAGSTRIVLSVAKALLAWANGETVNLPKLPDQQAAPTPATTTQDAHRSPDESAEPVSPPATPAMVGYYVQLCQKNWGWMPADAELYCEFRIRGLKPAEVTTLELTQLIESIRPVRGVAMPAPIHEGFDDDGVPIFVPGVAAVKGAAQ